MADLLTARTFSDGLVAEFGTAVGAALGTPVDVGASTPGDGGGWIVAVTLSGDLLGTVAIWINQADANTLAQRVMGSDDPQDDATIVDMLREMWAQATSALALKDPFTGVKAALSLPEAGTPGPDALAAYELRIAEGAALGVSLSGQVIEAPRAPVAGPDVAAAVAVDAGDPNAKLEVVLDIDLPLVVRFGRTLMTLKALADLGPGSIVDMGRSPDEPVELLVGDRVIARGEVVVVEGNYGVRIMDLVSAAERVRASER